jgi:hypothetical protein
MIEMGFTASLLALVLVWRARRRIAALEAKVRRLPWPRGRRSCRRTPLGALCGRGRAADAPGARAPGAGGGADPGREALRRRPAAVAILPATLVGARIAITWPPVCRRCILCAGGDRDQRRGAGKQAAGSGGGWKSPIISIM